MRRVIAVVLAGAVALSAAASAPAQAAAEPKLGPLGYGKLKIGQTKKQARRTGMIVLKRKDGCIGFDLKDHRTPRDTVGGYISKKHGVVAIFASKGMKTPKGIGLGATKAQVKKKYPKVRKGSKIWVVPASRGKTKTQYMFLFERNKLGELALVSPKQDCFN